MLHTLKCPSCSAPVDLEDDVDRTTVRCPFCNNLMIVPDSGGSGIRRRMSVASVHAGKPGQAASVVRRILLVIALFTILGIVATSIVAYKLVSDSAQQVARSIDVRKSNIETAPPGSKVDPPKPPAFAEVVDKFGDEGIGPGKFTDARCIAVDGEGRIYAADYTGGRVQVLDSSGKFLSQWMVDPKMALLDIAADRKGTVYIVQKGRVLLFEGPTGSPIGELPQDGGWFNDVAVTADGGAVAAWRKQYEDVVRFDSAHRVIGRIQGAIHNQTDRSELDMRLAVDGLGNVYALGSFNEAVFKFNPEGKFVTKFGSSGNEPGQFRAVQAVAVDSKGRVYVSDTKGVQVFDSNGRYIDKFEPGGIAFDMVFNDNDELFIASRTRILKLALKK